MQFVSLCIVQHVLHDLARVRIWVRVRVRIRVGVWVRVRLGSEICKLCVHDFKIAQHVLQIAQIDKLHTTFLKMSCSPGCLAEE